MATRPPSPRQVANALPPKDTKAVLALIQQQDYRAAELRTEALKKRYPRVGQAHLLHAQVLLKQTRYREAEAAYREALALAPGSLDAQLGLAQSLSFQRHHDEALTLVDKVLRHAPKVAQAWVAQGNIQKQAHELEAAVASYRKALALTPDDWRIYRAIAHLVTFSPDDPVFAILQRHLEKDALAQREHADLHFVLGKAYLDISQDEQAFFHYQEANRLMDESLPPIRSELEQRLTFTRRRFTQALFQQMAPFCEQACPQIIVAGMSRSGKSLVESLFRGVKGVTLAGEELVLGEYTQRQLAEFEGKLDRYLAHLTPERLRQDAQGYREQLGGGEQIKITTVPGDLWNLGLVGLWAPRVPIIFCVRNLLDLGVTGYFHQYQVPEGFRYSYHLEHMGRQIACSEKVMDHWAQVLPNPVYLVDYAALTADPEQVMGNLLEQLQLERDQPYAQVVGKNAALVGDLSPIESSDAPMPVTSRFNGFSERFRDKLQPLIEGYKTIADAFPRLADPAVFDQPLPETLTVVALAEPDNAPQEYTFDWQLKGSVTVIDNGAYLLQHAELKSLLNMQALGVVAFDPLSAVTLEHWQQQHPNLQHVPHALLGSGEPTTLHACLDADYSATLKPLPDVSLPQRLRAPMRVLTTLPVSTVALDAINGLESIDWLILDSRHDSMAVLEHGKKALADTLLIHAQVCFQPRYERQPNLAELQHWAARHGFQFYRMVEFGYDSVMAKRDDLAMQPAATELRQASVLFIPAPERLASLSDTQRHKLGFVLDTFYQIHDLTYQLLAKSDTELAEHYLGARGYFDHARLEPPAEWVKRVDVALLTGQPGLATRYLHAWRRDYPNSAEVKALRARAALLGGQDELAFLQMDNAIELAPENLGVRLTAIQLLLDTSMWWEALRNASRLYERMPEHDGVYRLFTKTLIAHPTPASESLADAAKRCDEQLAELPDDSELLTLRARLAALLGEVDAALAYHEKANQLAVDEPSRATTWRLIQHGHTLCESGDDERGCLSYWHATQTMPQTRLTPAAAQHLTLALARVPQLAEIAVLHQQLRELKKNHKGKLPLGRFSLLKQGWEKAWLPGSRLTEIRLAAYGLDNYLTTKARVLDVTAEHGLLLLGLAPHFTKGTGLQENDFDTELGTQLAQKFGAHHVGFTQQTLEEYRSNQRFDLILACGAHDKTELSPEALGEKLYDLCAEQGIVLLESRGTGDPQAIEAGFAEKATRIVKAGFAVESEGTLCDDGLNKREFWLLRKR